MNWCWWQTRDTITWTWYWDRGAVRWKRCSNRGTIRCDWNRNGSVEWNRNRSLDWNRDMSVCWSRDRSVDWNRNRSGDRSGVGWNCWRNRAAIGWNWCRDWNFISWNRVRWHWRWDTIGQGWSGGHCVGFLDGCYRGYRWEVSGVSWSYFAWYAKAMIATDKSTFLHFLYGFTCANSDEWSDE